MIEYTVIRNMNQRDEFIRKLKERKPPLKIAVEQIQPVRSLDWNAYLWGVVYATIAEATGQSAEEVHEGYKRLFRFRGEFRYIKKEDRYEYHVGTQSTASAGRYELMTYTMRVRADSEIELDITCPMPNEVFITEELNFDDKP